jgi:hypothetical protein
MEKNERTNKIDAKLNGNLIMTKVTKREYFAALAMQGLLTRIPPRHGGEVDLGILESQRIAAESRIMADTLLEELENNAEDWISDPREDNDLGI